MLSKCCWCIPLRIGSISLAVLWILQGIYKLVTSGGHRPSIYTSILYLIVSGCLLFGAIKYHRKAVLVSLILEALTVIYTMFVIIVFAGVDSQLANDCEGIRTIFGSQCEKLKYAVAKLGNNAGLFIGSNLFRIYFWICNYSFYKELKT